jgi:3-methyladenine DNA glycosylase AlkD
MQGLPAAVATEIATTLGAHANPERAVQEKRYLKSSLEHWGVGTPTFRTVVRGVLKAHPELDRGQLLALVGTLWASGVHELRAAALEALERKGGLLVPEDLGLVERLCRESRSWAYVDFLAAHVAGRLVQRHPELVAVLDRWAGEDDFWVRRAALLALLEPLRRGGGDFARFARYADAMLEEREFFIRKAIGWVLREVAKKRPELVLAFLEPRLGRVAGLTLREAARHLPAASREALLEAYRAKASHPRRRTG